MTDVPGRYLSFDAIAGTAAGAGTKMVVAAVATQFKMAALVATLPGMAAAVAAHPLIMTVAAAVIVGALAGGAANLARAAVTGRGKVREKRWALKAFGKGALIGAAGGGIFGAFGDQLVAGFSHALHSDFVQNIVGHPANVNVPSPAPQIAASAPTNLQVSTPVSAPLEAIVQAPTPLGVKDMLSAEQMKVLSPKLRMLAQSDNAEDMLRFCKEASYQLINGGQRSAESVRLGAELVQRGLDVAKAANLHTATVDKLAADMAYLDGKGTLDKLAQRAGSFVRYAARGRIAAVPA